ncbi:MAG TPA: hypothetical protein VFU46_04420 [Gemmatimonadales bacterium]|nr:hypothetical protein [Gemmatimonadales bacterium]
MPNPLGPAAFFALEAGECLDRLDTMFAAPQGPAPEELVRVARMLRGSALMANQPQLARAAAGFEAVGRALRDGKRVWDAATREQSSQAIEEFRLLLRRVPEWQDTDAARAARLAAYLESLAGQGPLEAARLRSASPAELQTGVRAFVAREGALIASALDRAARALRAEPGEREPLYMVLRRMQSLQGLAELPDFPPLPEILDGIELAVGDLSRLHAPPPGVDQVLEAGAQALSRVARDIAERGLPDAEAPEPRRFTERLLEVFAVERDVVPIEALYPAGHTEPVERPAGAPRFAPPTPPGSLELVSLGEHLAQTAGLLESARSDTELDLRLYRLIGTLRSAAAPHTDPLGAAFGVLARATREAVAAGVARAGRASFAAVLREAGELLRTGGASPDRMYLSRRLLDAGHRLDLLRAEPAPPAAKPAPPVAEPPVVPIESLAFEGMPARAEPAPPAAAARPAAAPARTPLEAGLSAYQRLVAERGLGEASLAGLAGAAPTPPAAAVGEAIVPIEALCYHGPAALARAAELRAAIAAQLAEDNLAAMRPLVEELLDLVPLALERSE